jgi:hypothetical protein
VNDGQFVEDISRWNVDHRRNCWTITAGIADKVGEGNTSRSGWGSSTGGDGWRSGTSRARWGVCSAGGSDWMARSWKILEAVGLRDGRGIGVIEEIRLSDRSTIRERCRSEIRKRKVIPLIIIISDGCAILSDIKKTSNHTKSQTTTSNRSMKIFAADDHINEDIKPEKNRSAERSILH